MNKTDEGGERHMLRTIKHYSRRLKRIQRNGKIFHAPGLEELILLNGHTTQSNLQIQGDPYQITNDIFHRTTTSYPKIYTEL